MIRALSISQPWADHIVFGDKRIENRVWLTNHRGPLLLHAAKSIDHDAPASPGTPNKSGHLIGVARVIDVLRDGQAMERFPDQAKYIFGPWCWVLEGCVALPASLPYRGMPSLFMPEIKDDLNRAMLEDYLTRGGYQ